MRGEWALLAALVACYPASLIVPPGWALEGALLENLQMLVLGVGCVLALAASMRARSALAGSMRARPARDGRLAALGLWAAPIWLLLAGRELSWGKVWLQQPGSETLAATVLWAEPLIRPGAALLLAALLVGAWCYRIDGPVRAAFAQRVPWLCLVVTFAAAMGSTCAEGHMSCHMDMAATQAQTFEELCELLAYIALCMVQNVVFTHHMPVRLAPVIVQPVKDAG